MARYLEVEAGCDTSGRRIVSVATFSICATAKKRATTSFMSELVVVASMHMPVEPMLERGPTASGDWPSTAVSFQNTEQKPVPRLTKAHSPCLRAGKNQRGKAISTPNPPMRAGF
jgi:hypothetical protein